MKAIIITVAYNAKKTIRNTIESVLSQSYSNFIYYIVDNGSTDGTSEVIREYAQSDMRIVVITKSENSIWAFFEVLPEVIEKHNRNDYLCVIDADDTYNYNFLEKMLAFMEKECLEIAACGNDFIDARTQKVVRTKILGSDLILNGDGFGEHFPVYYQFMRTMWAKVYSLSILLEDKFEPRYDIGYGGDTLFAIEAFRRATRVGILAESLHKYYVSQKSASYQFNEKRINSDRVLFDISCDFLRKKVGNVTKPSIDFLLSVYYYALVDSVAVLLKSEIEIFDKLSYLLDIYQSHHTQALMKCGNIVQEKTELFNLISAWVSQQILILRSTGLSVDNVLLNQIEVYFKEMKPWREDELFAVLLKLREQSSQSNMIDLHIVSSVSNSAFLKELDVKFLVFFSEIVFSVLQNNENQAVNQIKHIIDQGIDIPDEFIDDFLLLGLNLCAKLELTDDFVFFKKLRISVLIDFSKIEEARDELANWDEILPNDIDFKDLRNRLSANSF